MLRSLYSAVSGIGVNQKAMDVIGNNIANINTIGFKTGRAVFQDLFSQTLSTGKMPSDSLGGINPRQVGLGAYLVSVDNIFEQGTIKNTARSHDVAIEGNGFFVVRGEGTKNYYTRAGDFNFDQSGMLTTPSGYRVQGWMADPITGVLANNTAPGNIQITDAHNVMQARATTQVQYAGVLDTRAGASVYEFQKMLTQGGAATSIFDLLGQNGQSLGLNPSDTIRVRAHATGITSMDEIFNAGGQPINMQALSSPVTIDINGTNYNFNFVTAGADGTTTFSTMQEFASCIRNAINAANVAGGGVADASVTIVEGRLNVTAGTDTFEINSISCPANDYLNEVLEPLKATYVPGNTKLSRELYHQDDLQPGQDFANLDDLANEIGNVINGNVVGNFSASYLDNDFGLRVGDTVDFNVLSGGPVSAGGTLQPVSLKYVAGAPAADNEFHTVADFVNALTREVNKVSGADQITFTQAGDKFELVSGSGSVVMTNFVTNRTLPVAEANVSPYLEGILSDINGYSFNGTNRATVGPIEGKGRIVYNNGSANDITGFSITKGNAGREEFDLTILQNQSLEGITLNANDSQASGQFLTTADEDTLVVDLFTSAGLPCQFNEGSSTIEFKAMINGEAVTRPSSFLVDYNTTVKDFMTGLEEYLGLGATFNTVPNIVMENGVITLTGENGIANNIDTLTLVGHPDTQLGVFNTSIGMPNNEEDAWGAQFTTDMTIYDQQGNEHVVKFDFHQFNEQKNEWKLKLSTDDPTAQLVLNGTSSNELIMRFNPDGTPSYFYVEGTPPTVLPNPSFTYTPANGTNPIENVELQLGSSGEYDGLFLSAAALSINTREQDGNALGVLEDKMFNQAGEIVGVYTNGKIRVIGQLALATFENNQGLSKTGDTMFEETGNSGAAAIGTPLSGNRGQIASSSLEQSNVDMSEEFVNMIVTQRGFQANSRVVTTSDEMIQELLNLKR